MSFTFPKPEHDHTACIDAALTTAERVCRKRGSRFTQRRREALTLLWESHKPVSAYNILAMMQRARGRPIAPITVYRALEFLQAHGLAHRIESRSAYIGCRIPETDHTGQFLLCRGCGCAAEIDERGIAEALQASAQRVGFDVTSPVIEIEGACPDCREGGHG